MYRNIKTSGIFTLLILLLTIMTSYAQDKDIPESKLPVEIHKYITTHFPNNKVIQVVEDNELFSKSYEVLLTDNIKLEFNGKNKITDIDGTSKLPDSVIPKTILAHVKSTYPKSVITDWELDNKIQQIKLDNNLDLEFNMQGKFLRIDP